MRLRRPRLWLAVFLGFAALLGGCKAAGLATLDTANQIAKLGAYERTPDVSYGPFSREKLDVYTPVGRYLYRPDRRASHWPPRTTPPLQSPDGSTPPPPSRSAPDGPDVHLVHADWPSSLDAKTDTNNQAAFEAQTASDSASEAHLLPVVIYFHGGDWTDGYPSKNAHRFVADALTSRGFVAVVVNYRRYPNVRFPAFVWDAARSVAWVRRHIAKYHGDPNRIFVMGHSAGAQIGAMVALDEHYLRQLGVSPRVIRGFIGLAGPYNFLVSKDDPLHAQMPNDPMFQDLFGPPKRYPLSQPVNFVDRDSPPMLLLNGGKDQRVPTTCTQRLARGVRQNGGLVHTKVYPSLSHLMLIGSLATPMRWIEPVIDDIATFIHQTDHRNTHAPPRPRRLLVTGPPK